MAAFILVPGAWHGAWCWELVAPRLAERGHRVLAPDLPGMGSDRRPLKELAFDDWVDFVAGLAKAQDEPVVLVGHSRAGIVISQAAERAPDAIRASVYLAAMLVPDGRRMSDVFGEVPGDPAVAAGVSPHDEASVALDPALLATHFYNTTPPELVARAARHLTPEPLFSSAAELQLTDERFGRVPRVYVECLHDRSVPLALQRRMREVVPCGRVEVLDTDHSPFYSAPDALAEILSDIAAHA